MAMCPKPAPACPGCWRRAYSVGNSDMRVLLKHRPGARAPGRRNCVKILAALLLSPLAAAILAASPNRRALPLQKLFRAAGKLSAMFGRALQRVCRGPWRMSMP